MRLLLDTHAIIWWLLDEPRLSANAADAIRQADLVYVSAATGWEIATKVRSGRLQAMRAHIATFADDVIRYGFHHLAIEAHHGLKGGLLEGDHKDPFDRLIAAQALSEKLMMVTCDRAFRDFGCDILW